MTMRRLLHERRMDIQKVAEKHGAFNLRVFGSVVRGEEAEGSDIDFLVNTGQKTSSWFPGGLILELEEMLGRPVEIVTEKGLNPLIRNQVIEEAVPL